jgi:hypothetical protein
LTGAFVELFTSGLAALGSNGLAGFFFFGFSAFGSSGCTSSIGLALNTDMPRILARMEVAEKA